MRGTKGDLRSIRINTDDKGLVGDRGNMMVRKKIGREEQVQDNPKIVVYVVGGMGFNEIRCVNKFANKFTMVSGSNQLLTPAAYIKELNHLAVPEQEL